MPKAQAESRALVHTSRESQTKGVTVVSDRWMCKSVRTRGIGTLRDRKRCRLGHHVLRRSQPSLAQDGLGKRGVCFVFLWCGAPQPALCPSSCPRWAIRLGRSSHDQGAAVYSNGLARRCSELRSRRPAELWQRDAVPDVGTQGQPSPRRLGIGTRRLRLWLQQVSQGATTAVRSAQRAAPLRPNSERPC